MLLANLLSGRENSKLTTICDTALYPGHALVKCVVKAQLSRVDSVIVILLDLSVADFLQGFQEEEKHRLDCHDFYSDISNWDHHRDPGSSNMMDITARIKEFIKDKRQTCVVINSLSQLLLDHPLHEVHHALQGIVLSASSGEQLTELVVLVHADLHTHFQLNFLRYSSTTVLQVQGSSQPDQACQSSAASAVCFVTHVRKSGKVLRKKQPFSVSPELELVYFPEEVWTQTSSKLPNQQNEEADPTASLTFSLSLSDKEREARESTRLPYTLDQTTKANLLQTSIRETGASQIFYMPDDVDDFDDDDPDDDLDI